jgi:UPF0716 family protein affecting phage T7 exclusion
MLGAPEARTRHFAGFICFHVPVYSARKVLFPAVCLGVVWVVLVVMAFSRVGAALMTTV